MINDTVHYCNTESVTIGLIEAYRSNEINKDMVIVLDDLANKLDNNVYLLEQKVYKLDSIVSNKNAVITAKDEQKELDKATIKKNKIKSVLKWFENKWEVLTISTITFGVGVGVGYTSK